MKKIIIGNWKMAPHSVVEVRDIVRRIVQSGEFSKATVVICPPSIFLREVVKAVGKKIFVGAQDCYPGETGANTGEVSVGMLKEVGVKYVLVGHSERRAAGETNELINLKLRGALSAKLKAVFCVGEKIRDDGGDYLNNIKEQLVSGLAKVRRGAINNLLIAYEPVWAIGRGAVSLPSPDDVFQMTIFIKKILVEIMGREDGARVPILYGGSVDAKNAKGILFEGGISGLLIGRESLRADHFLDVIRISNEL